MDDDNTDHKQYPFTVEVDGYAADRSFPSLIKAREFLDDIKGQYQHAYIYHQRRAAVHLTPEGEYIYKINRRQPSDKRLGGAA